MTNAEFGEAQARSNYPPYPDQSQLTAMFSTMVQGVVFHDSSGRVTSANPAAEDLLGLTFEQMAGRKFSELEWHALGEDGANLPADQQPSVVALRTGKPALNVIVGVYRASENRYRWLRVNAIPYPEAADGEAIGVYATLADITVWHESRSAFEESERRRQTTLAQMPIIYWAMDASGIITLMEGSGLSAIGMAPGQQVGRSAYDIVQDPAALVAWRRALAGEDVTYESSFGQAFFHHKMKPQFDDRGLVTGVVAVTLDVTERRRMELALLESEQRLRLALESGRLGSWEFDLVDGEYRSVSDIYKALLGLPIDKALSNVDRDLIIHPEDLPRFQESIDKAISSRDTADVEYRVSWPDGSVHWLLEHILAICDEAGAPLRLIGATQDITERKRAEVASRENEQRLLLALESGGLATWEIDLSSGEFCSIARKLPSVFGYSVDEPFTRADLQRPIHPDEVKMSVAAMEDAIRTRSTACADHHIRWPDGTEHWVRWHGQGLYDATGHPTRMIGAAQDITEQKEAELALRHEVENRRMLLRDVLNSATGGKLRLVDVEDELPARLDQASGWVCLSQEGSLREAREQAKAAAGQMGFALERCHDLTTAASEAAMNVMLHAGGSGEVTVTHSRKGTVQVHVRDWGPGIRMDTLPKATLMRGWSSTTSLGHGLAMMLDTVDRLWLLTGPDGTIVVMEKDREEPVPAWLHASTVEEEQSGPATRIG